jgi:putative aldouronate transport system permease protein
VVRLTRFSPFDLLVVSVLLIVSVVCLFPLLYVVSVSLTPIDEVFRRGGIVLIPMRITLEGYERILTQSLIPNSFRVTVFVTIVGTALNLTLTVLLAYPLSRSDCPYRRGILLFVIFTMLFNGGLIPTYLVVKGTGLLNTIWAMIIPNLVWAYNTLIMKSFFERIPDELFDSARIDGAHETRVLVSIVLPLSGAALATIGLFYAVGHWNQFLLAILYVTSTRIWPLQVALRSVLMSTEVSAETIDVVVPTRTLQMASVVVSALPIIAVYPFLQRYFVKGVTLGAVKG